MRDRPQGCLQSLANPLPLPVEGKNWLPTLGQDRLGLQAGKEPTTGKERIQAQDPDMLCQPCVE